MSVSRCICGADAGAPLTIAEQQFGTGEEFTYLECMSCGSLRIASIPSDMSRYYPRDYYSFASKAAQLSWRDRLQPTAMRFALFSRVPQLPSVHFMWPSIVQILGITRQDRVLDVGSGTAGMVTALREVDHRQVLGVDPFIRGDVHDSNGLAVKKAFLCEMEGIWDVIVFNHSLEHNPDPVQELRIAKRLIAPGGRIIVRLPVAAWAYKEYGAHWVQLDAPRHLFVPTEDGFRQLATRCGLRVAKVTYDSNYTQFWHSEKYRENVSLVSMVGRPYWEMINREQRAEWTRRARQLNQAGQGDQAAFFLFAE